MTRENKLALVVAFALILTVGILVSDHFTMARQMDPADLQSRAVDPTRTDPQSNPDILVVRGQTPRIEEDFHDPGEVRAVPARKPVVPPDALPPRDPQNDDPRPAVGLPNEKVHHVGHRETLGAICRAYYGDASLAEAVAQFNGLSDPNKVQEGMRLRLPEFADRAPAGVPATSTTQVPTPAATRTYTVKPNDSLARIAKRELGAEKRWEEIYNLNRKVLRSPDHVVEGVVLTLPAR